jgi:type III pantothenate kinase
VGLAARHELLPLEVRVDSPERVGVDRLLNAVAANFRLLQNVNDQVARGAVIIDAGTAVTVDVVSSDGAFEGGAIFPGRRLMAAALHEYTALLPFVVGEKSNPPPVGTNTIAAIETGIYYAVAGGINELIFRHFLRAGSTVEPAVFLTGGDAPLMQDPIHNGALLWPEMTLEGLRLSAEAQP